MRDFTIAYPGTDVKVDLEYAINFVRHCAERAQHRQEPSLASELYGIAVHLESASRPVKKVTDMPEV